MESRPYTLDTATHDCAGRRCRRLPAYDSAELREALVLLGVELLVTGNHLLGHGPQLSSVFVRHMGAWTLHWPPTLFAFPAPAVVLTRVRRDGVVEDAEESGLCATPWVHHASHLQDGLQHGVCAALP